MKLDFSIVLFESDEFTQRLDKIVMHIHNSTCKLIDESTALQLQAAAKLDEELDGISPGQYERWIRNFEAQQLKALSTMTLTLTECYLVEFVDLCRSLLPKQLFPKTKERYGRSKAGKFERLAAEYKERCGIEFAGLAGYLDCTRVILARNCCVHNNLPNADQLRQMSPRLIGADRSVVIDATFLLEAIEGLKNFAKALAYEQDQLLRTRA